jgi:hypothetical protein
MSAIATHWGWPALAAALPWPAGFALLARVASADRVRFETEDAAYAQARRFGGTGLPDAGAANAAAWRRAWRLVRLVSRSDRWLDRNVSVHGAWPTSGPFLAVTCHWGAGLWALRHLARAGNRSRFLARRLSKAEFGGDPGRRRYMHMRIRATERASRAPVIYTGGATAEIAAALDEGTCIVALCDVPLTAGRSKIEVPFRGGRLTMPRGLIALACARNAPVVLFSAGIDRSTGQRRLDIAPAGIFRDPVVMAGALARWLDDLLARDAPAWHMWPYAAELFGSQDPPALALA